MGQKVVKLPTTPVGWAIRLTQLVKVVHEMHGLDRFPINVADIARDFSRNVFPEAPITLVEGRDLGRKFEGALIAKPDGSGEWGIFFNDSIPSQGRKNFTLAHELGHYLLHRLICDGMIQCGNRDMWTWDSTYGQMEAEANLFASYLLMPRDDFDIQTAAFKIPTVLDFDPVRHRYAVSLTASILKWLEHTPVRAMIVVSRDGFIDWSWASKPLLRSNIFFRAKQTTTPLPIASLAARQDTSITAEEGILHPPGIWWEGEEVFESVVYSEYHDMAVSLLIFPNEPAYTPPWLREAEDEPALVDVATKFGGH